MTARALRVRPIVSTVRGEELVRRSIHARSWAYFLSSKDKNVSYIITVLSMFLLKSVDLKTTMVKVITLYTLQPSGRSLKLMNLLYLLPEVNNTWSYISIPLYNFVTWSVINQTDVFTFIFHIPSFLPSFQFFLFIILPLFSHAHSSDNPTKSETCDCHSVV